MPIYVIRHAKAGSRREWTEPDELRPLSKSGRRQALALRDALAGHPIPVLLSSPYVRCVQTLEPLAAALGLTVQAEDVLAEGTPFEPALALVANLPEHAVLCSHGDVIPELIAALHRRGMELDTEPDWRKASTWVLHREGDQPGSAFVRATVVAPPA